MRGEARFKVAEIEDAMGYLKERVGIVYPFPLEVTHVVSFLLGVEYAGGQAPKGSRKCRRCGHPQDLHTKVEAPFYFGPAQGPKPPLCGDCPEGVCKTVERDAK